MSESSSFNPFSAAVALADQFADMAFDIDRHGGYKGIQIIVVGNEQLTVASHENADEVDVYDAVAAIIDDNPEPAIAVALINTGQARMLDQVDGVGRRCLTTSVFGIEGATGKVRFFDTGEQHDAGVPKGPLAEHVQRCMVRRNSAYN